MFFGVQFPDSCATGIEGNRLYRIGFMFLVDFEEETRFFLPDAYGNSVGESFCWKILQDVLLQTKNIMDI